MLPGVPSGSAAQEGNSSCAVRPHGMCLEAEGEGHSRQAGGACAQPPTRRTLSYIHGTCAAAFPSCRAKPSSISLGALQDLHEVWAPLGGGQGKGKK